jgi:hypothetical protein
VPRQQGGHRINLDRMGALVPLSAPRGPISFRAMPISRFGTGIRVGTVAAAATIGAIIGLGLRHGLALRPFSTAGRGLLTALGDMDPSTGVAAVVGIALVALAIILLGVCFTFVAAPLRGIRLLGAAIAFAAIGWAISVYVVPSILVLSAEIVLGTAQRVFICTLLAISLVVGMRLARPRTRIE